MSGSTCVDHVRVVHQLALFVVERDVEVLREHELAHDPVDRRVELGHVLDRARRVGDPVQRVLDLQRPRPLRLGGLQLGDALAQRADLVGCVLLM